MYGDESCGYDVSGDPNVVDIVWLGHLGGPWHASEEKVLAEDRRVQRI